MFDWGGGGRNQKQSNVDWKVTWIFFSKLYSNRTHLLETIFRGRLASISSSRALCVGLTQNKRLWWLSIVLKRNMSPSAAMWLIGEFLDNNGALWSRYMSYIRLQQHGRHLVGWNKSLNALDSSQDLLKIRRHRIPPDNQTTNNRHHNEGKKNAVKKTMFLFPAISKLERSGSRCTGPKLHQTSQTQTYCAECLLVSEPERRMSSWKARGRHELGTKGWKEEMNDA